MTDRFAVLIERSVRPLRFAFVVNAADAAAVRRAFARRRGTEPLSRTCRHAARTIASRDVKGVYFRPKLGGLSRRLSTRHTNL